MNDVDPFTLISFIAATALVAVLTRVWVKRLRVAANTSEEYFTGGRALGWPVVAGSLLLTNLSTEQLVGLNGAVYGDTNLVAAAWELLAALAMIGTALWFLPRYLRRGFTTTPAYLAERYDRLTASIVSGFFLLGYVTVLLPVVLYTGSLALAGIFGLELPLWVMSTGIALLGSAYAIFGGLKTVAVSDTINGVGLLIGGLAIPVLALAALGEGSAFAGLESLVRESPESLRVLGGPEHSVPWPTLLTGMMLIQLFYWSTNQVIVQRAMGAKSLADGQKGVLLAAGFKLLGPLILCLPGLIALRMPELSITAGDQVYPALVRHVLPGWSLGLFAAVLVGSILSSFNSALNSAATLYCLEFHRSYVDREIDDDALVRVGKRVGTGLALFAMVVAPLLAHAGSIFEYLQKVNGLYSVPIISIFVVGSLSTRADGRGAKVGIGVGLVSYALFSFVELEGLHWLHGYAISFVLASAATLLCSRAEGEARETTHEPSTPPAGLELTPWEGARHAAIGLTVVVALIYAGLSWISS